MKTITFQLPGEKVKSYPILEEDKFSDLLPLVEYWSGIPQPSILLVDSVTGFPMLNNADVAEQFKNEPKPVVKVIDKRLIRSSKPTLETLPSELLRLVSSYKAKPASTLASMAAASSRLHGGVQRLLVEKYRECERKSENNLLCNSPSWIESTPDCSDYCRSLKPEQLNVVFWDIINRTLRDPSQIMILSKQYPPESAEYEALGYLYWTYLIKITNFLKRYNIYLSDITATNIASRVIAEGPVFVQHFLNGDPGYVANAENLIPSPVSDEIAEWFRAKVRGRTGQVFVKTLTGRVITLDVYPNDTVADLKSLIFWREGIPRNRQQLIIRGREARNNENVGGVTAIIHLVLRLPHESLEISADREHLVS